MLVSSDYKQSRETQRLQVQNNEEKKFFQKLWEQVGFSDWKYLTPIFLRLEWWVKLGSDFQIYHYNKQ